MANFLIMLFILFFALYIEETKKIPSPISLILLSFSYICFFDTNFLSIISDIYLVKLIIFLLPIIILSDLLTIKLSDLKQNIINFIYLAGVAIIISTLLCIWLSDYFFDTYGLNVASIIILFSMLLATDPVSVVSIFKNSQLPHKLKILAEGESLFNDAMALIIFNAIGIYMLNGNNITPLYILNITFQMFSLSVLVGSLISIIGFYLYKNVKDISNTLELLIIIIISYASFYIAENIHIIGNNHLSGILAEISSIILFKILFEYEFKKQNKMTFNDAFDKETLTEKFEENIIETLYQKGNIFVNKFKAAITLDIVKKTIESTDKHRNTINMVSLLALFANSILFMAMAKIINIEMLQHYFYEILMIFGITTIVRGIVILKFALLNNKLSKNLLINFRWWLILLFAGIKGGISIVMLHLIPNTFIYKEMFKAIIVGNILLTTILYSIGLFIIINLFKKSFKEEIENEIIIEN